MINIFWPGMIIIENVSYPAKIYVKKNKASPVTDCVLYPRRTAH